MRQEKYSYEDFLKDRIEMLEFDESIFFPEQAAMGIGFTIDDFADITAYFRWIYDQQLGSTAGTLSVDQFKSLLLPASCSRTH